MPADVSFTHVSVPAAEVSSRRLPLGVGLIVGAGVSVGLWVGIVAAVKALLF